MESCSVLCNHNSAASWDFFYILSSIEQCIKCVLCAVLSWWKLAGWMVVLGALRIVPLLPSQLRTANSSSSHPSPPHLHTCRTHASITSVAQCALCVCLMCVGVCYASTLYPTFNAFLGSISFNIFVYMSSGMNEMVHQRPIFTIPHLIWMWIIFIYHNPHIEYSIAHAWAYEIWFVFGVFILCIWI